MLRRLLVTLMLTLLLSAPATAQTSWQLELCLGETDGSNDEVIESCTEVLNNRRTAKKDRVVAYYRRGAQYYEKSYYDLAILDYSKIIELDPAAADAYRNRSAAYRDKGDLDRASADYTKAIAAYAKAIAQAEKSLNKPTKRRQK